MNKSIRNTYYLVLTILLFSVIIVSCNTSSKSETETTVGYYKTPETIPLKFTDPESFEWETITSDTLTTPVTYSLNVDELPSKPFELNSFKPLKAPMKKYNLDWDNFPTVPLKFDSVPFTVTKSTIKKPTITKMNPPGIMEGTQTNLLQLSTNEGLINNNISSFLETDDGAIWIASPSGSLTRYDGENSFVYDYPDVFKMAFDKEGRLWLAAPGEKVTVLDFSNDIEYKIRQSDNFVPLDILCDYRGTIYIVSVNDGLYMMDPEMKNLQKLTNEGSNQPWRLFEDSTNKLWLGSWNGIVVIDKERKEFKKLVGNADYDLNAAVIDIKEDRSGHMWLNIRSATNNNVADDFKVLRLSPKDNTVEVLDKENGYDLEGWELIEDDHGNLWILGQKEAFILSENATTYKTIELNSNIQANRSITRPLLRKDGSLWISTTDKGVIIANDFTLKTEYLDESRGLINNQVWTIEENSRGEIWLGTLNGINIIDTKQNTIKAISNEQLLSTPNNRIRAIKEISTDIYYINTSNGFTILDRAKNKLTSYANNENTRFRILGDVILNEHTFLLFTEDGLHQYDIRGNTLKKVVSKTDSEILNDMGRSSSGLVYYKEILWIPSRNGLIKVNLNTNTVSYLKEEQGLCSNACSIALMSKEGELWVATLNGIAILDLEENTLTNLKEENGLVPAEMYDLIEKGTIIYAASVNGLIPIEKSTAKTTNKGFYNFNAGLGFKRNDYLQGSPKFLKNGQFWAGVANTLSDVELLILDNEPKPDSIISRIFVTDIFVMDENPGFDNKNSLDSLKNKTSSYATKHNIQWDSVTFPYALPKGLVLPYDQNSLSFSYGSDDVFNREQLTYRFILDGEDANWTYAASTTKTKNYYNLKPGNYTFKVSSRSSNQDWSTPTQFEFRIAPPWWQTWWAYVLFGIVIVSILRAYIIFKAKKLKKENRILEERVTNRTEQLKNKIDQLKATQSQLIQSEKMASLGELTAGIAHEIQNPLNFVNNFSEVSNELIQEVQEERVKENEERDEELIGNILNDIQQNLQKINHHGKRADAIVKGMLQHSRANSAEKEPTDINKLADEYLRLAYHGLRAKDKSFNASLETNYDESVGKVSVIHQDIGRVILNLITNAFYVVGEKKKLGIENYEPTVTVTTKRLNDEIIISIKDNGNGIPKDVLDKIFQPFFTTKPAGQGTGLGLSMSYDIITKGHGGELTVETKEGESTEFIIHLPL